MAGEARTTTDHDVIREWVENRNGRPATVQGTGEADAPGVLRILFPGYGEDEQLTEISWDEFFQKFEAERLAFLYQEQTADGQTSRFAKFVSRDSA